MSVVTLKGVHGTSLRVTGLDCLDNTPLIDIKPYFASVDSEPDAVVGWHRDKEIEPSALEHADYNSNDPPSGSAKHVK